MSDRFRSCYIAVAAAGKKADSIAARLVIEAVKPLIEGAGRLTLALDDTPTQRYGPQVQGAGHPSQPDPRPGRRAVRLRPRVGRPRLCSPPTRPGASSPCRCWPGCTSARRTCRASPRSTGRRSAPSWRWPSSWCGGPSVAGAPGQAGLGGGRRGVRQGRRSSSRAGARGDGRQPPAQGRGPADRARPPAAGSGAGPGSTGSDGSTWPSGPGSGGGGRPGRSTLYGEADGEEVQDVRGDVAAGRRRDPGGAGGRAEGVGGVLLHRPGRDGGRHPRERWPSGSAWRSPSAT